MVRTSKPNYKLVTNVIISADPPDLETRSVGANAAEPEMSEDEEEEVVTAEVSPH